MERKIGGTYPVVGETYDGFLNDIYGFHVKETHVLEAINNAAGGKIEEGKWWRYWNEMLGFQRGYRDCFRKISLAGKNYTLGVLVQSNFGSKKT